MRLTLIIILSGINIFALILSTHPHVSENYRNFYIRQSISKGEYQANETRGVYTSHEDRWSR